MVWNIFIFPYTGKAIIPFDFHIFQRGRLTTNQISYLNHLQTCHLPSCNSLAGAVPVAAIFTSREPFVKCSWAPILRDRKNHSCQVHNLRGQSKFTRDIWMSSGNQTWQCLQSPLLMDRSSIIYKETHNNMMDFQLRAHHWRLRPQNKSRSRQKLSDAKQWNAAKGCSEPFEGRGLPWISGGSWLPS